ncbi:metallophosphoesterase [Nitrogeniibacter mangrovi]|uniref:Metallophosphoesterase n=1 Tax=Nitrogeniibacter mangrovi TaxID=2016596 RepID=A0A6C1B873_9RHOO|nr:metallophosphoesterase [Nitrogeniibacter mangrovi]QID18444.1 metallophosphoesterase [Nitrogeniibacter mangrovi]
MTSALHDHLRLVHISDLHFGAQHPGAAEALLAAIDSLAPSLILITGDLTQRARHSQFLAARRFFDRLPCEWMAIPGNHDMPLFRPWHRLFTPHRRYRHHIGRITRDRLDHPRLRIALLDSTDPLAWRGGRLRSTPCRDSAAWLAAAAPEQLRIAAAHHPFASREAGNKGGMAGAREARRALIDDGGADVLLWGHLHRTEALLVEGASGRCAVGLGVGSPTSNRHIGEGFFFHQMDVSRDRIDATVWRRFAPDVHFHPEANHTFAREAHGWTRSST